MTKANFEYPMYNEDGTIEKRWMQLMWEQWSRLSIYESDIDVASVAANATAEQTFTLSGLETDDIIVSVTKPSHSAGLGIVNYRISAADTIAITYMNTTGGAIDPASETYKIVVWKFRDRLKVT